jgi:hypothetical protein
MGGFRHHSLPSQVRLHKICHELPLAKHSSYELWLAVPKPSPAVLDAESSVVQLRFKGQPSQYGIVFSVRGLEVFYDTPSRLMEYIRSEYDSSP